jgi:DHA1 family bicyclomycin/chloramphenicol resistance-like MFS transporter
LITIISIFIGLAALCGVNNPVFITALMCMFALPMVLPVNILYPLVLDVVPETKSRAAAVVNVARLVVSAVCIEIVSYFYNGKFLYLGLLIFGFSIVGLVFAKSVKFPAKIKSSFRRIS